MDILAKNLLILASAGSGKTFQLSNRIIGLVARGVPPERIVALTFTRKAAGEFADAVLTKLAEAAEQEPTATRLRADFNTPDADFKSALAQVVKALPKITLGTMDGFFARIIRSFQYELGLTGGKFDLLEGPRASAMADELLAAILADTPANLTEDGFYHAFRRATIGREDQTVTEALRNFVNSWHGQFRESPDLEWGPAILCKLQPEDWPNQKSSLAQVVRNGLDHIDYTRKGQRESLEKEIDRLESHVIGSGSLGGNVSSLMESIMAAAATTDGPMVVKSHKEFTIGGPAGDALREMVNLAAQCEFSAALLRTRAVRDVITVFDELCEKRLRRKGLLGFNDVKLLMGEWAHDEDARLRREAVDFRLDSRTDHWLLDEFQDTSRADWAGLLPLVDEAATSDESTMFIVGDRKQAIYAWRGGDVGLFDEVLRRYGGGLETAPLVESWRSCPEVLALVNRVCGDTGTMRELFGDVAARWEWEDHISADPLARPEQRGQARVERVGDWEQRLERLSTILHELGVGTRAMTCGVLLRGNEKVRQVADDLRARGFDVIEEGRRLPGCDNPVGVAITHLLKWLADPADPHARGVLEMSPLAGFLIETYGPAWRDVWTRLTREISANGYAMCIGHMVEHFWDQWSDFGRRRAGDLIAGLATLDRQQGISARAAADWLEHLEFSQSPGVAAVQVMTIHKAKGLGFDVVILPEISPYAIPQAQYFDVAKADTWLTETPPKWARALIPELQSAEDQWNQQQRYEAFCILYVALTRAKRGLYVLLDEPPKSSEPDRPSLANWITRSLGDHAADGVLYQNGGDDWVNLIPLSDPPSPTAAPMKPAPATARPTRVRPSAAHNTSTHRHPQSPTGMQFGTEVHAQLEQIAWADESPPILPQTDAGRAISRLLQQPALHDLFHRRGRPIELFREQAADAILNGKHITGVIDRLHLHHNAQNQVTRIDIIDFKTDTVPQAADLAARYSGQMEAYRQILQRLHPDAEITCSLLSTHHAELVSV